VEPESSVLSLLGRRRRLFERDLERAEPELAERIAAGSFLVIGGAGSIGQAVVKELFRRRPRRLHVVDLNENGLVELVRDVRSSLGYIAGDFQTLPLDCGGPEFSAFLDATPPYDTILNLSALKHVRSEKDPYTLMRMLRTNVLNTESTLGYAAANGVGRYFAVSSDKAANPANAMGATKRAMELCLIRAGRNLQVSSARFANVAFSDGSLLQGFTQRLAKRQPLAAPRDVRRYFITAEESAVLCLLACLAGGNRESFFPHVGPDFAAVGFQVLAERFLASRGLEAHPCADEDEARDRVDELAARGRWPCFFFDSDTTGEKELEEFTTTGERVELERFAEIGVVQWNGLEDEGPLDDFLGHLEAAIRRGRWTRDEVLGGLKRLLPEFRHLETGRFLDQRM
jgi:FlaA1/EpsC-like NDP-sugar epimerase